jgi:hypothetical protein
MTKEAPKPEAKKEASKPEEKKAKEEVKIDAAKYPVSVENPRAGTISGTPQALSRYHKKAKYPVSVENPRAGTISGTPQALSRYHKKAPKPEAKKEASKPEEKKPKKMTLIFAPDDPLWPSKLTDVNLELTFNWQVTWIDVQREIVTEIGPGFVFSWLQDVRNNPKDLTEEGNEHGVEKHVVNSKITLGHMRQKAPWERLPNPTMDEHGMYVRIEEAKRKNPHGQGASDNHESRGKKVPKPEAKKEAPKPEEMKAKEEVKIDAAKEAPKPEAKKEAAQQQSDTQGLEEKTKASVFRLFKATKHQSDVAKKKNAWTRCRSQSSEESQARGQGARGQQGGRK